MLSPYKSSDVLPRGREAVEAHPVAAVVTVVSLILFLLHVGGVIKVDIYALILLAMAAVPWSLPWFRTVLAALSEARAKAILRSLRIRRLGMEEIDQRTAERQRVLDDLILDAMASYIYDKLKYLHLGARDPDGPYREYLYVQGEAFDHDLRYLRDHGFLEHFAIGDLQPGENLVGRLTVTEIGRRFVNLKEKRGFS